MTAPATPTARLREAAGAARYAADIPDPLREPLAAVLEKAAAGYQPGVLGNGLVICPDCCEQVPCSHIKPALALADAILAAVTR